MIRKIGLTLGAILILVGCQADRLFPKDFSILDALPAPAPVVAPKEFGDACAQDDQSIVLESQSRYGACVNNTWTELTKEQLESRVITYDEPRVALTGVEPLKLGSGARYGQCLYTISYASDYTERQAYDKVVRLDYNWQLKIAVKQPKPAMTPADCETTTVEQARDILEQNWSIDPVTHRVLGRKRETGIHTPLAADETAGASD